LLFIPLISLSLYSLFSSVDTNSNYFFLFSSRQGKREGGRRWCGVESTVVGGGIAEIQGLGTVKQGTPD
jgi:hypothetical protein